MEFEILLEQIQNDHINHKSTTILLNMLLKEIQNLLLKIKECDHSSEAEKYFLVLAKIQFKLAKLMFINNLELSPALNTFVWDFDRIDDAEWKNYLFEQIINNQYILLNIIDNN